MTKGDAGLSQRTANPFSTAATSTPPAATTTSSASLSAPSASSPYTSTTPTDSSNQIANQPALVTTPVPAVPNTPVKAPKPPMDPAKKKKIIRGVIIGVVAVLLGTAGIITTMLLLRVDYSEAYRIAQELNPEVEAVYRNTSCQRVLDYVDSTYTRPIEYNKYVDTCLSAGGSLNELTQQLSETAGVKRNQDIKKLFDQFHAQVERSLPNQDELTQKLDLYRAWHEYEYLRSDLEISSPNSAVEAAVQPLIGSGNSVLKDYGENWQKSVLAITAAYRTYDNLSYGDPNKSSTRLAYQNLQSDHNDWVALNKPDIQQLGGLNFGSSETLYRDWTKLYHLIRTNYEEE